MTINNNKTKIIIAVVIVIILALGFILSHASEQEVIEGMVDTDDINIASKVTARVETLHAKEGDTVHPGETLVTLYDRKITEDARQAQGSLSSAIASQDKARNGERSEYISSLKAKWESARADENIARVTSERMTKIYDQSQAISTQDRDDAVAKYHVARQQTRAAYEQYVQAQRGNREEDLRIADANVSAARAAYDSALSLVKELTVHANVHGEIAKRFANPGELVSAGTPIFSMIDLNNLWVTINLREDRFNALKMGEVLTGNLPALNKKDVKFSVFFINPKGSFATWRATRQSSGYDVRTYEVRLRPVEKIEGMRPGMTVIFNWPAADE
ncbi:HlyD family secretion protein [Pantoea sp. 1.19]|uniref:HlyD family secretion protein n=1 Tax=Pantoea sp. 1.19 TaxID=1925589 RepID=UPI001F0AF54B|nr:HlyD family secretion protein [Pantoea sp. 1.19]